MEKKVIYTQGAPEAIGPYSQGIQASGLVFLSGQIALRPGSTELVNGSVTEETEQVMQNLQAVLSAAGLNFSDVIKTTIFLGDMDAFAAVNEVYGKYFKDSFPARETVAVKGLPRGARVEISMIAAS